jgi:hypothetical protein
MKKIGSGVMVWLLTLSLASGQQRRVVELAEQSSGLPYQVGVLPPEPRPAIPPGDGSKKQAIWLGLC